MLECFHRDNINIKHRVRYDPIIYVDPISENQLITTGRTNVFLDADTKIIIMHMNALMCLLRWMDSFHTANENQKYLYVLVLYVMFWYINLNENKINNLSVQLYIIYASNNNKKKTNDFFLKNTLVKLSQTK